MKADDNETVEQLMKALPRTGNRYLDLTTGEFVDAVPVLPEVVEKPKKRTNKSVKK